MTIAETEDMTKQPFLNDVSVLILFHTRAEPLAKVFAEVRKARPARLFLYQDGPRQGRDDMPGILACREVVGDGQIDWQCEVHRCYQERNYGVDPSEYMSQRWAFSMTDKCIVFEDDDVPSQSFFPFCKEMLDRYEHDERVTMVAGFNVMQNAECRMQNAEGLARQSQCGIQNAHPSYFFTRAFSIWGWASWARVINRLDGDYGFVNNPQQFAKLQEKVRQYRQRKDMPALCRRHAATGVAHYETILWAHMLLNDGLAIMPALNQINNIGLEGGAHYATQLRLLPRRLRWQFEMPRHELAFPLVHPTEVKESPEYQEQFYLVNAWNNPWRKVQYSLEELWLNLRYGNFSRIGEAVKARLRKTFRRFSLSQMSKAKLAWALPWREKVE